MKTVLLLFTAARFSVSLVRYMVIEGRRYGWKTCVGSMFDPTLADAIRNEKFSSEVVFINFTDYRQCDHAIRKADIVAGMLPDSMILQVADLCIANKKSFITPAVLSRQMLSRKAQVEENEMLLLMECGFAPGLDHVTARKAIDNIRTRGGRINSFKTFHGTVVAESAIDNPWQFKLNEPVDDVLQLGRQNNRHLHNGRIYNIPYHQVFKRTLPAEIDGLHDLVLIPEGDALYLRKIYQLSEATTVMRGTIARKAFVDIWKIIVELGLTDTQSKVEMFNSSSFYNYLQSLLPWDGSNDHPALRLRKDSAISEEEVEKLRWLGLFDQGWVNIKEPTPASILRVLLEQKFKREAHDKDCIIMQHDLEYELKNVKHTMRATLVAQGEIGTDIALSKATGLMVGAALKSFLLDNMKTRGLHIPITPDIYDPMLNELDDLGVAFYVEERKHYGNEETDSDNGQPSLVPVPVATVKRNL